MLMMLLCCPFVPQLTLMMLPSWPLEAQQKGQLMLMMLLCCPFVPQLTLMMLPSWPLEAQQKGQLMPVLAS